MTDETKPAGTLTKEDLSSLLRGAVIAVIGAALAFATQSLSGIDFGPYAPFVGALLAVATNVFRKWAGIAVVIFVLASAAWSVAASAPFVLGDEPLAAASYEAEDPRLSFDVPKEIREWYRNPDGSCVQCSIGMCGVDQNQANPATLLWDTEYGGRERGGSGPDRVANYCRKRGIKAYNVTGSQTYEWMAWACRNGRGAAIGAGGSHFQTLVGHDPQNQKWWVCNNNSPQRVDEYSESGFHRLHEASGEWAVILDYPPHPARPRVVPWWK